MKTLILHTAYDRFLKFGIREISIQKIVEPLGISTKTVYKYYNNKEELLEAVLLLHYDKQFRLIDNLSADMRVIPLFIDIWFTSIEQAFDINNLFHNDLHYYYPQLEQKIEKEIGSRFGTKFKDIIRNGIRSGVFRDDIIPEAAMEAIYVLFNSITRSGTYRNFNISPTQIFLNSIAVYIRGLCSLEGIKEFEEHLQEFNTGRVAFNIKANITDGGKQLS
jgi:AcrR family transcriptional regulator